MSAVKSNSEVVVIGGGVIGCATAYELSKAGVNVTLVEAREIASAASGASAGGVRQQNRDLRELPIARRAIARWPTLGEELGADLHYRQDGNLRVIEREEDLSVLEDQVRSEQAKGLEGAVLDRTELREVVPDLAPNVIAGSWCPTDGHAMPILVTKAFADAARRLGASIRENTLVTGVEVADGRVATVNTNRGRIPCEFVVNAAGMGSVEVGRMVGLELPIYVRAPQIIITSPSEPKLKPVLGSVGRKLSLKQLPNGAYLVGGGWPGTVSTDGWTGRTRPESIVGSANDASSIFPPIRETRIIRAWVGLEANAVDDVPVLGTVSQVQGFLLACGFSGHGFALAPCVGELLTEIITTGQPTLPIDGLSYDRFGQA